MIKLIKEPERLLGWWDDLDDLVAVVALSAERIRRVALLVAGVFAFLLLFSAGILLAFAEPPLALAMVTLLSVTLLYRTATRPQLPQGLEIQL
ncbi:MAG: hypothetical protein QNJ00_10820 [Woeseiaceae bacterium]|nr:hypothetical protein [Woeseiaceae bacterium]